MAQYSSPRAYEEEGAIHKRAKPKRTFTFGWRPSSPDVALIRLAFDPVGAGPSREPVPRLSRIERESPRSLGEPTRPTVCDEFNKTHTQRSASIAGVSEALESHRATTFSRLGRVSPPIKLCPRFDRRSNAFLPTSRLGWNTREPSGRIRTKHVLKNRHHAKKKSSPSRRDWVELRP